MKEYTIKTYQFNELSKEQKEKAIENYRLINVDYDEWDDNLLYEWERKLARLGFVGAKISYTGFYSQGDGASFEAQIDLEQWLRVNRLLTKYHKIAELNEEIDAQVERIDTMYSHENTVRAYLSPNYIDEEVGKLDKQMREVEELINNNVRELSRKIYQDLERDYDYLTADAQVAETLEINEYDFTTDGKIYN